MSIDAVDAANPPKVTHSHLTRSLYNADRIGLDLYGMSASGDTSAFTTDLAQGENQAFVANLLTANLGAFSAQYLLNLSDADFGAGNMRQSYQLTLSLVGSVFAVPIPGPVWLFGFGSLGLLGWRSKSS